MKKRGSGSCHMTRSNSGVVKRGKAKGVELIFSLFLWRKILEHQSFKKLLVIKYGGANHYLRKRFPEYISSRISFKFLPYILLNLTKTYTSSIIIH